MTNGNLVWRVRPAHHFIADGRACAFNKRWSGIEAFTSDNGKCYKVTTLSYLGKRYRLQMHRVLWALSTGQWPRELIDHIDGNPNNNRMENLREATMQSNCQNNSRSVKNTSGKTGVYRYKPRDCWTAVIGKNNKPISLGYYKTFAEACAARKAAEKVLGFSKRHGSTPNPIGGM